MPPMKTAPKKAPGKPQAPKKPSTRSKTGNSACSQAASNWQLAIRGKAPLDPDTYKTLGKCRAMARSAKSADDRADMGYNLSEQGRTALKGRLQKRFDEGLITQKSRKERLKTLLAERKEKQASVTAKPAPSPAPATKPTDKATPGENKIPESKQVQAMKNKLERMKAQFDSKFEDWSGQTRGHGGTPFIMDNSKGRAQYKRHQKGDESLRNLDKAIKEQEEKIQAAQYRHIRRHTQTKKSEKFIEKNPVSPGLQYLEQKGLVKSWPKKPEVHFVQGLDKTALITVDGRVGVSRGYNGGSTENFLAAKRLASIANSYNRTQSLVSSVRQNPGYGVARAIAVKNRELVGLKIRDKGTLTTQAPAPAPSAQPWREPKTYAQAKAERYKRASYYYGISSPQLIEQKRSQRVQVTRELRAKKTAMREGAIPLSMKPDKIPRGFEATLASASQGGKIVTVSKPVKGSDYAAVQLNDGSRSDKYKLVDPKSGTLYGGSFGTVKDAEATAKRVDRLVKRASRGLPQNSSVEEIVTSPGKIGYFNLIRDTVLGRTRKRK